MNLHVPPTVEEIDKEIARLQNEIHSSEAAPNLTLWTKESPYRTRCYRKIRLLSAIRKTLQEDL